MVSQIAAEKFLKNSSFSMEEMVNSTPSCMKIINREGQLLSMNSKGLALIEAEDMESVRGANVYDIVEESHRERFREFNEKSAVVRKAHWYSRLSGFRVLVDGWRLTQPLIIWQMARWRT